MENSAEIGFETHRNIVHIGFVALCFYVFSLLFETEMGENNSE
jgi:hypothetical protein